MNSPFLRFCGCVACMDLCIDDPRAVMEFDGWGAYYIMPAAAEWDDASLAKVGPLNWDSAVDEQGFRRNPAHLYPCPECGGAGEFTADDLRVRCRDRACPLRGQELSRAVWQHLGRGMQKVDGRIRQLRRVLRS